ncbi:MAG: ABC transporter permease [Bdellovibrionales bacterium]|nr:ABC transporter permease [Bdellovibrionales bacterium]
MRRSILKKSFAVFLKRNLAFANLAIVTNLEYRLNYFIDALVQPILTTGIEILLWIAVFKGAHSDTIAGFSKDNYLSYALWSAFFARIATSWMYEFRMIEEVSSGTINSLIVRPMSFYEYYLSQLMGYKLVTTAVSLIIPVIAASYFNLPSIISRLPLATLLCFYYLILVHTISFIISTMAFHFTKISSLTVAKNLFMWILMGELFPLDLLPEPWKTMIINIPFASGVFIPVAYITGRVEVGTVYNGFISVTVGLIVLNLLGAYLLKRGIDSYVVTGA